MSAFMHARFLPADATLLRPEDLPAIPQWYPLPPKDDDGNLLPAHPPEVRAYLRHARQVLEACTGPYDGHREQVRCNPDGSPPAQVILFDGTVVYVRDDDASSAHQVAYRYSPQLSPMHPKAMAAVADGFNEYGQQYALEATHDDTTQLGYAER